MHYVVGWFVQGDGGQNVNKIQARTSTVEEKLRVDNTSLHFPLYLYKLYLSMCVCVKWNHKNESNPEESR